MSFLCKIGLHRWVIIKSQDRHEMENELRQSMSDKLIPPPVRLECESLFYEKQYELRVCSCCNKIDNQIQKIY